VSRYLHADAKGERKYSSSFLNSTVDGVSGQRYAPAVLYPREKDPRYPLDRRLGGASKLVWTQKLEEKFSASVGYRMPVVQSVVRLYTDWDPQLH
jgi:hypothetical protein